MNKDKLETNEQYKDNGLETNEQYKDNEPKAIIKFFDLEINNDKTSKGNKIKFSFNLFSKTVKTDKDRLSEDLNNYDDEIHYISKTYLTYIILFIILFILMFNAVFKKKPVVEEATQQSQELFSLK